METLERLRGKIDTARELHSVVKTMKGLAAANIRHLKDAVDSLDDYRHTVELSLQELMRHWTGAGFEMRLAERRPGAIVFGSEQGFAGRFNQQVGEKAAGVLAETADRGELVVLAVGQRVVPTLEEAGFEIDEVVEPASSIAGVTPLVQDLLLAVERWRQEREVGRVQLFYNLLLGGSRYEPTDEQLYPVDVTWLRRLGAERWPSRRLPAHTMPWHDLFAATVRELLFVLLYRAAAESLASENASRLSSMQAAERNIDERLGDLNQRYRRRRQTSITEELLDIVAGFEALAEGEGEDGENAPSEAE